MTTLETNIRERWLHYSRPAERTRHAFQLYYWTQLREAGKKTHIARYDAAGNCTSCGESGRCPGWHYEGEFETSTKGTE